MGEFGEFCKDMRAAKKQRAQRQLQLQHAAKEAPAPPKRRCYDWMIVGGTAHYAKNRSSFITYRRVARRVKDAAYGIEFFIAGIGTVELRVCSGPGDRAPVRTLVLENVLHAPSALCNGFSIDLWSCVYGGEIEISPDAPRTQLARDNLGEPYWYAVPFKDLEKLVLAGDPQGESYLDDGPTLLSMFIPKTFLDEIQRGRKAKRIPHRRSTSPSVDSVASEDSAVPFTGSLN